MSSKIAQLTKTIVEIIIVEDEDDDALKYKLYLEQKNSQNKNIKLNVRIYHNDTDVLNDFDSFNSNSFFILDLILSDSDTEKGKKMGRNVLEAVVKKSGKKPIFVKSGNLNLFAEIFQANENILKYEKKSNNRRSDIDDIYNKIITYISNSQIININVTSCSTANFELLEGTSVNDFFKNYYADKTDPTHIKDDFIARAFLVAPKPFDKHGHYMWEIDNTVWAINVTPPTDENDYFLQKKYNPTTQKNISISFKSDPTTIYQIANKASLKEAINIFSGKHSYSYENSPLEKLIIEYFFVYRIGDLYLEQQISINETIAFLAQFKKYISNEKQDFYDNIFIFYIWEKLTLESQKKSTVNSQLNDFFANGFSKVLDIFYCRFPQNINQEDEYIHLSIKTLEKPYQPDTEEYLKSYIQPNYLLKPLKPFKLIYYQPHNKSQNSIATAIELILQEEFNFLNSPIF